jgi:hypothetical protein
MLIEDLTNRENLFYNLYHELEAAQKTFKEKEDLLNKLIKSEQITTPEDLKTINKEVFLTKPAIALMLEYKSHYSPTRLKKAQELGEKYEPFLLTTAKDAYNFQEKIAQHIKAKESFLYNVIYRIEPDAHCTAAQFYSDGIDTVLYYVDSLANPDTHNPYFLDQFAALKIISQKNIYSSQEAIQADSYSCVFFGIQNLNTLSNMSLEDKKKSFFGGMEMMARFNSDPFERIDGRFLKNAQQQTTYIKKYLPNRDDKKANKAATITVEEYMNKLSICVKNKDGVHTLQNRAIDFVAKKYVDKALELLLTLSQESLSNIIEKRSSFDNKNTFLLEGVILDDNKAPLMLKNSANYASLIEKLDDNKAPLMLKSSADDASSGVNSFDNLHNLFHQTSIYFKISDSIVDVFKFCSEPTMKHFNILSRDYIHLISMTQAGNYYSLALSATDIINQVYQEEYKQAVIQAATTTMFALSPMAIGPLGSACSAALATYTGYEAATNLYSFYLSGAPESQLRSKIAWSKLSDYWGFKDAAKNYLVDAMNIAEKDKQILDDQEQCSEIQRIAEDLGLPRLLCELGLVDDSDCYL